MRIGHRGYDALDLAKWICSLMVVVIHCVPLSPYSLTADVYTAQGICRISVPLFYAIAGFLLFQKIQVPWSDHKSENRAVLLHYCKSIATLYLVWSAIYFIFPTMYQYGGIDLTLVVKQVKLFFFEASYYHL